jgi:hypothetical protein
MLPWFWADNVSCWALDSELREYDPFASTRDLHALSTIPGLAEAYESVDFALESGVGLEPWKEQIILQTTVTISDDDSRGSTLTANSDMIEDASDLDEDMQEAIRESRKEYHRLHGSSILTAPAFRMQSLKRPAIKVDDELLEVQNDKVQVSGKFDTSLEQPQSVIHSDVDSTDPKSAWYQWKEDLYCSARLFDR